MPDLSDGVNWSETDANNNQAPPNGWPEGMMPSGVNDAARADRGAMKRFWNKLNPVQAITPSSGVFTFTTGNSAYPTAYVAGEIYTFRTPVASVGNDQFQVNSLGPKPIWKYGASGWGPILAYDIVATTMLFYAPDLNSGSGAFILLNPFVPLHGDGTSTGLSTGDISAHTITASGGVTVTAGGVNIQSGGLSVLGDISGHTVTATGGMVITAGGMDIESGGLSVVGDISGHTVTASGSLVATAGGLNVTGDSLITGNLSVTGTLNGHPAMVLDTLTARITSLEAAVEVLRDQVRALQG